MSLKGGFCRFYRIKIYPNYNLHKSPRSAGSDWAGWDWRDCLPDKTLMMIVGHHHVLRVPSHVHNLKGTLHKFFMALFIICRVY